MSDLAIRAATEADLAALFAIYDQEVLHGTATFDTTTKTPAERVAWLSEHRGRGRAAIVAEQKGALLGFGTLSAWSTRCAYARAAEDSIYVAAAARGRGVGRALLLALIAHARTDGLGVLLARVVEGNPASLHLHATAGFQTIGVMHRVGEKLGRILDVTLLELLLDAASGPPANAPARFPAMS